MDKDNVVVGYVVPLLKGGQRKDVVVPATPELSQQIKGERPDPVGMDVATDPPPVDSEYKDQIAHLLKVNAENPAPEMTPEFKAKRDEALKAGQAVADALLSRKKGTNPWAK